MQVKQLAYLTALARERHFGRAAEACGISQPALSAAIRAIEAELGVRVVERAQRFKGFTPEGQAVLDWAQRLLHDFNSLKQELTVFSQALAGRLRLGVIPAALPVAALLTGPFSAAHPSVSIQVTSLTSKEIQRGLDSFELDIGLTYLDDEPLSHVRTLPLYRDRFWLLAPRESHARLIAASGNAGAAQRAVTWTAAAAERLCLLSPDMQNRRIIDRIFASVGQAPRPVVETNALITLVSHVRLGGWSTIVPQSLLLLMSEEVAGLTALPLVEPAPSYSLGLAYADREPVPGLIRAALAVARRQKLQQRIDSIDPRLEGG